MAGTDCFQYFQYRYFRQAHFCRPHILRQLNINLFAYGAYNNGEREDHVSEAIVEEVVHAEELLKKPIRQFVNHLARRATWRAIDDDRDGQRQRAFPDDDNELTALRMHDPTPPPSDFDPETEDFTVKCERKILIERALEAMPELRRSVFKASLEGYTTAEIASMRNLSVDAVQKHLQRARKDLRGALKDTD